MIFHGRNILKLKNLNYFSLQILKKFWVFDPLGLISNHEEKQWLEALLHPRIKEYATEMLNHVSDNYAILVIPLLNNRTDYPCQRVCVIHCEASIQKKRVLQRETMLPELYEKILSTQPSDTLRRSIGDDFINNSSDTQSLYKQIEVVQ